MSLSYLKRSNGIASLSFFSFSLTMISLNSFISFTVCSYSLSLSLTGSFGTGGGAGAAMTTGAGAGAGTD